MASYTTNLNLKKPAGSENVSIGDINNNMDLIDQAYGTLNSNKVGDVNCGTANSNNTLSVSMNNNERSIIVGIASHERRSFMVFAYVSGSGSVTIVEINKGNNITLTTGTNTMNVANSDTQDTYVFKMVF